MNNLDYIKINIHGSCCSRDIFNFIENEKIMVNEYIARQSIISSVSEKITIDEDYDNFYFRNNFQRKSVVYDLEKELFNNLKNNKSDYLMIDLIDERFDIVRIDNKYITCSLGFNESKLNDYIKGELIQRTNISKDIWIEAIDKYIDKIKEIYDEREIIIHEVYFANKYIDKDNNISSFDEQILKRNKMYNDILSEYYEHIKSKLKKARVIDISKYYFAYENHVWGLAPFHYEDDYYKDIISILCTINQN